LSTPGAQLGPVPTRFTLVDPRQQPRFASHRRGHLDPNESDAGDLDSHPVRRGQSPRSRARGRELANRRWRAEYRIADAIAEQRGARRSGVVCVAQRVRPHAGPRQRGRPSTQRKPPSVADHRQVDPWRCRGRRHARGQGLRRDPHRLEDGRRRRQRGHQRRRDPSVLRQNPTLCGRRRFRDHLRSDQRRQGDLRRTWLTQRSVPCPARLRTSPVLATFVPHVPPLDGDRPPTHIGLTLQASVRLHWAAPALRGDLLAGYPQKRFLSTCRSRRSSFVARTRTMTESSPTVALPNSTLPAQPRTRILRTLADAVRGVETDLTEAPLGRALLMLAIPMILEMVMESVFAMVDVYWVAHLGARAVATVGLTESMMMIIYSLAMGVSIGAMALVARRIGEKDADAAASVAVQGIWLGLIMALTIGVAGVLFAPRLLALMGADAEVVRDGSSFTRVMLGGNATVFLLFLINSVFRGAGDAAQAMRILWLGNALNIVLGPLFIFGIGPFPELGVTGAA